MLATHLLYAIDSLAQYMEVAYIIRSYFMYMGLENALDKIRSTKMAKYDSTAANNILLQERIER